MPGGPKVGAGLSNTFTSSDTFKRYGDYEREPLFFGLVAGFDLEAAPGLAAGWDLAAAGLAAGLAAGAAALAAGLAAVGGIC